MAFIRSPSEQRTVLKILLNLINSYWSTVFIDSPYFTGCFLLAYSTSRGIGSLCRIYAHFSFKSSSGEAPAPATVLGSSERTVLQTKLVSIMAELISAFACRPNTSVGSLIYKSLI